MEDNKKKDVDMTMETEVIKALKEEFEAKIASQKETYENILDKKDNIISLLT